MTSPISSYSQTQGLAVPAGPTSPQPLAKPQAAASAGSTGQASVEAVTLTPDAQTSAALLDAARAAVGVDNRSVQTLRAAIAADSYHVPPDQLATSIVAALASING